MVVGRVLMELWMKMPLGAWMVRKRGLMELWTQMPLGVQSSQFEARNLQLFYIMELGTKLAIRIPMMTMSQHSCLLRNCYDAVCVGRFRRVVGRRGELEAAQAQAARARCQMEMSS